MSKLSKSLPYHLFVEGKNDLHVVSSLCGLHHVNQNFNIKVCESVENAIGLFRLTLTNPSAYPRIGVVLDADTDVEKRWRQLVDILKSSNKYDCDGLDLPSDGLVLYPIAFLAVVQPFKHFFHSISNTLSVPVAKFLICQIGSGYSE